ncbi:hypothetical protein Hanom_Chr08g00748681 [Helianthus anomalus]
MTAENLTKMADKVMMAKALEVDSTCASESETSKKVSSSGSDSEPGKAENAKSESDCRNCMKGCKVCNTHEYLSRSQIQELINKINILNKEVIGREKLIKSSTDRINELNEKSKLMKMMLSVFEKKMKTKIENERINLKLNSYSSSSFVLQHIVPKPIGKNKDGEDVYADGTGVRYQNEDSIEYEVVKGVVEKVLKSDSGSTNEDDECFLNINIPKPKSQNNLDDEPTLVMYKMNGSDKLYPDKEFLIEYVNVDKLNKVFKLVETDISEVEGLSSSKRFLNFQRDKSYYNKPSVPPGFHNNNQNRGFGGHQGVQ